MQKEMADDKKVKSPTSECLIIDTSKELPIKILVEKLQKRKIVLVTQKFELPNFLKS